ncbi:DUF2142 domain-containing protein [Mucilaginibacter sp. CSA2-8R]|uniref:DUF2142 domain-containing protein n=1 Tax=Mucilaginibacter sp. CSA2-8R TaxID=3141542 RepID=UPI00315DC086
MNRFGVIFKAADKYLHFIYLLYAVPMVYFMAIIVPPYQSPDEPNHFSRAEQVSRLEWVPAYQAKRGPTTDTIANDPKVLHRSTGGFRVSKGIADTYQFFSDINFKPNVKTSNAKLDAAKAIRWTNDYHYKNFANTAIYPPLVYIMPALGISAGKLLHLGVIKTLYLSRILNGIFCVTLSFFALMLARRSKILLFIALLFPMTLFLFGSVTQDAVLISCSFLLVAIIDHVESGNDRAYKPSLLAALIILMTIITVGKPPYLLLSGAFLFLKLNPKQKAVTILVPTLIGFCWLWMIHSNFAVIFAPSSLRINAKLQVLHIMHHPFNFLGLFFKYDGGGIAFFCRMVVGVLGWLDTFFSSSYYHITYAILALGLYCGITRNLKISNLKLNLALFIVALLTLIAILTVQYITWTALESPSLGGMQGRYFLPIYPMFALSLCISKYNAKIDKWQIVAFGLVLLFPILTFLNVVTSIISRYYLV